jgi:ABC-type multidrug transport system ATPase subunit
MKIFLTNVGKRYNRDWIFRHLTYEFSSPSSYAITGPNGSGKSTLLQVIAGAIETSEGKMKYEALSSKNEDLQSGSRGPSSTSWDFRNNNVFQQISIAAPYLELVEEMTANEFLGFHTRFKPLIFGQNIESILKEVGLEQAIHKQIRYYSSGMKQRIKLAQAVYSDTPVVLLDEPCTNLDEEGVNLYHRLVREYCSNRLVIVSSNDEVEYRFCDRCILITDHKK